MNLPPFVYSLAFWRSVSIILAVVAVQLGWVEALDAGKILVVILGILELFDIRPELRAKGLLK